MIRSVILAMLALVSATAARAAEPVKPLFAADDVIRITIKGPIGTLTRAPEESNSSYPGTLTVAGTDVAIPIMLSQRGITRRKDDVCQFPPLRVSFPGAPPAGSLFEGQKRLKLVTHCRSAEAFQQYLLMEYATYRLYNKLSPMSLRARLVRVDYVGDNDAPVISRMGFFLEPIDDAARRNGLRDAKMGQRFPVASLSAVDSGRVGVFEYMIGNLDWAMQAGPPGDNCCHNTLPIGPTPAGLVPVPYDWDFSGLVDAPYATPPDGISVTSIRQRRYRGFCRHNAEARAAIAAIRPQQAALMATFGEVPGLEPRTVAKAKAYLSGFFADIATDASAEAKLIRNCL